MTDEEIITRAVQEANDASPSHRIGTMWFPWQPEGQQWATFRNAAVAADNWRARWEPISFLPTQGIAEEVVRRHRERL